MNMFITDLRKIIIAKFDPETDLLESLSAFIKKEQITNAIILNGIGSCMSYSYHVVSSCKMPPDEIYVTEDKALDITGMQGFILDGRAHAHITFADEKIAFGGHLEKGVKLLTFAILTLGVIDEKIDISTLDKSWIAAIPKT